mmetsp:Transcript_4206/g.8525  ORF Transcript_4206/g.8525 Transcript_4206/m.8525 type:complete len:108 (+) Transcript_4206:224-547(+)
MMLTTQEIILEYVCPLLGCIFANMMFAAPYKAVSEALAKGTLGSLNPTPWAAMTGNCSGWIAYSYLIKVRVCYLGVQPEKNPDEFPFDAITLSQSKTISSVIITTIT